MHWESNLTSSATNECMPQQDINHDISMIYFRSGTRCTGSWSIVSVHCGNAHYPLTPATFLKPLLVLNTPTVLLYIHFHTAVYLNETACWYLWASRVKLSLLLCVGLVLHYYNAQLLLTLVIHMGHAHTTNCSCQYTSGNSDDVGSIEPILHFRSIMKHSSPRKWRRWCWWEDTMGRLTLQAGPHVNPAVKLHYRSVTSKCTKKPFSYIYAT